MTTPDLFQHNRVILTHFDSYSAALLFPRWGTTLLWPAALPEAASPMPAPPLIDPIHASEAVRRAVVERCALNPCDHNCRTTGNGLEQRAHFHCVLKVLLFTVRRRLSHPL